MKRILLFILAAILVFTVSSCGGTMAKEITVISREANSGTRGAFDELMKIKENDQDMLFSEAIIVDSTDAVTTKVEVDESAIGYTSLGAITDKVTAVSVDGIAATTVNVKNGSYKISRPFLLATKGEPDALSADFIQYITSKEGQNIVNEKGYIAEIENAPAYTVSNLTGKITLSGSTSVEKVMEKLKEEYIKLNPNMQIEIIYSGSSAGIKDAKDGKVQIAMSSRELKAEEKEILKDTIFARDGIAVIVNKANSITAMTSDTITKIFKGEVRNWDEVK